MVYKADFHTHSAASPDGALSRDHYKMALEQGELDYIAVTDHNTIEFALQLHKDLGDRIIIGEEITTQAGEIIGLYLTKAVPPMLTLEETIKHIRLQHGLVYVPHPFETVRKGITATDLSAIAHEVDIIEIYNGRAVFQSKSDQSIAWASEHGVPGAAASDSHGWAGWGRTYTVLQDKPARENLVELLDTARYAHAGPGLRGILYPKFNRLRKQWGRHD